MQPTKIKSALISVFHKNGLDIVAKKLHELGVEIYSTGGTQSFIEKLEIPVKAVEDLTSYPSIFGGRVKTLHPKVFGGILARKGHEGDQAEMKQYEIPAFDLVIVDLYPFEETVSSGASHADIIEKIDIGGISLIRAAAKNYQDVTVISSFDQYETLVKALDEGNGSITLAQRKSFASFAFAMSSHYDTAIYQYFAKEEEVKVFRESQNEAKTLRYGENPHQKGTFYGDLDAMFDQVNGKALSYNNLVDIDAAVALLKEFEVKETIYIILKHTNACGVAIANTPKEAYLNALKADNVSAFGGVLATNQTVDLAVAEELHKLFFEVLIAPAFDEDALALLKKKKNRVLLIQKPTNTAPQQFKTLLNGVVVQDQDLHMETIEDLKTVTKKAPSTQELSTLIFASKLAKHTKSNTIVLAKENQLLASGVGQTSRVDALEQAIAKAKKFGFDLNGAVMASDAFFPFPDCVEIAEKEGIKTVIQPGGSIRDQESIDYCDNHDIAMVITGIRHFKH